MMAAVGRMMMQNDGYVQSHGFIPEGMRANLRAKGLEFAGIQGPKAHSIPAQGNALGNGITMNIEG